ncbi:MAG: flagellar basal-body MS-ring/collar protein FliF [Pseudomonadota bacterium]|uniref:flagellar basal-body MS-ring/collar protein FliF n=1 Tax=Gallaecimonas pentaromativorans TaxID=584787 RepID=UPI000A417520|nr:flagellar basal-body MS-ring/collar protein FliF [Gallaecimonas pentaromativorans]MED5526689.1 flagellar basal-body MS-ring/collar protein FliF [Pseudomonadota bacterium]
MANENTQLATVGNAPAPGTADMQGAGAGDNGEQSFSLMSNLGNADVLRQISLVLGLAIGLALVVLVFLWAKEPEYRPLGRMETNELVSTLDFLDQHQYSYKIEGNTVLVPEGDYQKIKLAMTRAGMSSAQENTGDDILMKDMGFGVSQRLEQERLKFSREQQLSRAIEELSAVKRARVLLAIPKDSVFLRERQQPSATVVLNLARGSSLKQEEVDSIVDMVASAVHGLSPDKVTVTDQNGRLLNSGSQNALAARSRKELELETAREKQYLDKVDSIMSPVVGLDNYTAQVDVSMDFTAVEQTQKRYNPDQPAVRSEMSVEENRNGGTPGGVPGALSNQPPAASQIPEDATNTQSNTVQTPGSSRSESTKNFELDTTISHTQQQVGTIDRMTVSVAVDYKNQTDADGKVTKVARSPEELDSIKRLLMAGLGINPARGDSLEVLSVPFARPDADLPDAIPFYETGWFARLAKVLAGALIIIVLIFVVVRPLLKRLMGGNAQADNLALDGGHYGLGDEDALESLSGMEEDALVPGVTLVGGVKLPDLRKDEEVLKAIRALVANEPELSAQVVKGWLTDDGK